MKDAVGDKYSALWVSHTSIGDFLRCPRAYYLKNIYRNPSTGRKIKLMSPPLALGQSVHEVLDMISNLPQEKRFEESLVVKFDQVWQKVSGRQGGFVSEETELKYKMRGEKMLAKLMKHPGPLSNLAVKIKQEIPFFWLSTEANIILCGKIDWLEYLPATKSVHIIDFKTSMQDENEESLQLPIYYLIASNCQKYPVEGASYWYLERSDEPKEVKLKDIDATKKKVIEIAKRIKTQKQLNVFKCLHKTGCFACNPMEKVLKGEAEFVGTNSFNEDIYILDKSSEDDDEKAVVL